MASKSKTRQSLVAWASECPMNLAKVRTWREETIDALGEGKGAQIISASTGGNTFTMGTDTTHQDWFNLLSDVITQAGGGNAAMKNTIGVIDV